jgi:hypothetical protein
MLEQEQTRSLEQYFDTTEKSDEVHKILDAIHKLPPDTDSDEDDKPDLKLCKFHSLYNELKNKIDLINIKIKKRDDIDYKKLYKITYNFILLTEILDTTATIDTIKIILKSVDKFISHYKIDFLSDA